MFVVGLMFCYVCVCVYVSIEGEKRRVCERKRDVKMGRISRRM